MELLEELQGLIVRHCAGGRSATAIPKVSFLRADAPTVPVHTLYEPMFCVVAQGSKQVMLGDDLIDYSAGKYVVVSVDLPVTGCVCQASADRPYLGFSMTLDTTVLAEMLLEMTDDDSGPDQPAPPGLRVSNVTVELLEPVVRMLRLLDRPRDIPMLSPLVEREILYRLLEGEQRTMLRQIALAGSRLSQVGRAIQWIKTNYSQPFRIETVAKEAGMSPASLHRHFKAVTSMSPLQYQKRIRLQEARQLLVAQRADAASIGFTVGYQSPSQFSREYARLFGVPPARDAARLRGSVSESRQVTQPV